MADADTPTERCTLHTLPPELILEIISAVRFTPATFVSLRLTCRRFHDILTQHEGPISIRARHRNFDAKNTRLFPGLEAAGLRNLAKLHARVEVLEIMHEQWSKITSKSAELEWLSGRWEGVHKAGLLLLYHLRDISSLRHRHADDDSPRICQHCSRIGFLRSLPATSLACVLFTLISSVRILRIHGPEPINEAWSKGDPAARSDVELVCEEVMLSEGPGFFIALLGLEVEGKARREEAVDLLTHELTTMHSRQSPAHPPTLIATLRRALAEKSGVDVRFAVSKMWEVLASTGFDDLETGEGGKRMVKVVRGEELTGEERGMRRIF